MFSKALFKQSWKANGLMWGIITFAVCFMLACVMLITGGGNIAIVKNGVEDTIIQSQIEASAKKRAINYYEINTAAMEKFDSDFLAAYTESNGNATIAYASALKSLQSYTNDVIASYGYTTNQTEGKEIYGAVMYTLNPMGQCDSFYTEIGETPMTYDMTTIASETRESYRTDYCAKVASMYLASNMTTESAVEKLVVQLSDYGITREKYDAFGYDYATLKDLSMTGLYTYEAQLGYEISKLDASASDYAEQVKQVKESVASELSGGFLATLPQEVSDALEEIGGMDLYNLIVGSIFYKMAGLLLPFIYVIMVSNSLIAGQVDSGSMAYILSTSTKRREVTFTQAMFLICSIFLMVCCMTLTSVICLAIVASPDITLTYAQLIWMNLGSFMVLFAVSGICFLASCWFNRSKKAMALGGGVSMFFLVATMLGLFGSPTLPSIVRLSALNYFNYVSIISLFDIIGILGGSLNFLWKFAILFGIGLACYIIGSVKFRKKDLPL